MAATIHLCAVFCLLAFAAYTEDDEKYGTPLPDHLPLGIEACFGRVYDANHLSRHSKQRVTSFHIFRDFSPDPNSEVPPTSRKELIESDGSGVAVNITTFVRFRDRKGVYSNSLNCRRGEGGKVRCGIDCDGGTFNLKTAGKSLIAENNGFVVVGGCGASEDDMEHPEYVSPGVDDKTFRLDPLAVPQCVALRDAQSPAWAKLGPSIRTRLDHAEAVCFTRSYDAGHLASHPAQTVKRAAVIKTEGIRTENSDFPFYKLVFRVELKDGRKFEKETTCAPDNYAYGCTVNMDYDTQRDFYLTRAGE
jgi:hypothetical protein